MTATVIPGSLCGQISAPPSKSAAHRALICAALGGGKVQNIAQSTDMQATITVLHALKNKNSICNCKESGSTLRFLLPIVAALGLSATFSGEGRLPQRPLEPLLSLLKNHGITFSNDTLPFSISGKLNSGLYELPGDVSSQFISGLLFALPLLDGNSNLEIVSQLQSAGYVQLTLDALHSAGIVIQKAAHGWHIPGQQSYQPHNFIVEGDWSNAAFWLCAGALYGDITVNGLSPSSQGDSTIIDILKAMGAKLSIHENSVSVSKSTLFATQIDAAPIPDLIPILAVTAAYANGITEIYNAARLRIKESDRLTTVTNLLRSLGGKIEEYPDKLIIHGGKLIGGKINGSNDHRIVMSGTIAALGCKIPVTITDAQAIDKSYPDFFEAFQALGGIYHVF